MVSLLHVSSNRAFLTLNAVFVSAVCVYAPSQVFSSSATSPNTMLGPRQALGIPIYNIPMQTVVIGGPADSNTNSNANQPQNSSYWYDAACVPPQQHGGMFEMQPQQASAAGAAAGNTGFTMTGTAGVVAYPPQPPAYAVYASYPPPQSVAGTAVGIPAVAGTIGAAGAPPGSPGVMAAGEGVAAVFPAQPIGIR